MNANLFWKIALATAIFFAPVLTTQAAEKKSGVFRDAYYLETHEGDLVAAARLYETIIDDRGVSKDIAAEARSRLARCREDLKAADMATLMPADTILYAELRNPGKHLEKLMRMLDVVGNPLDAVGQPARPIPGEPGFVIPQRILLSSALIESAKSFEGVAFALTGFDIEQEQAKGVLVLHPGDLQLMRGLIETTAQFLQPTDPIAGFPTIEVREAEFSATIAFTQRLVIAGTDRSLVQDVIGRLQGEGADSLASVEVFQAGTANRDDAMIYAFANVQEGLKIAYRVAQQDGGARRGLMQAQAMFDLAHMNALSMSVGAADDALQAEFVMSLANEQTSLAYNLLRTPPMKGRVLELVPASAAAVFAIGINPDGTADAAQQVATKAQTIQAVTGLDLGRELFANIREAAVFVTPPTGDSGSSLPDVGIVLAVGDVAKSEALWSYLLSLPIKATGGDESTVETMTVDGVTIRAFPIDDDVKIHLARTDGSILVGLTQGAIRASIAAQQAGTGVLDDPTMKPATARIGADTSIALFGHFGRIADVARHYAPPHEAPKLRVLGEAARDTMLTITIDESQTRFRAAGHLSGLPHVESVLNVLAEAGMLGNHEDAGDIQPIEVTVVSE